MMKLRSMLVLALALLCTRVLAQVTPGTSPLTGPKGGTNNAFMQFTGPATSLKTFTLPNASSTLAALSQIQTWTGAQSFGDGTLILLGATSGSSTLKAPATGGGTATLFAGSDTVAGISVAQTLTNKTLTAPVIATISNTGTLTLPTSTDTLVGRATTDTFTNKTFDTAGAGNVFKINGTQITANTGSGSNVLATSPTLVTPTLGAATATTINGVSISAGNITGEPSTGSASAGNIGEYVESVIASGSAVSLTTATPKTVTSISLTAGDWDVDISTYTLVSGTTNITQIICSISGTTNALDVTAGKFNLLDYAAFVPPNSSIGCNVPPYRLSLSATTSVFMVLQNTFTVSTASGWGLIRARRVR